MRGKVQKWGNSLAVRIPRAFAEQLGVGDDSEVELIIGDDGLLVRPVPQRYILSELLERVTDANVHEEVRTGERMGREQW